MAPTYGWQGQLGVDSVNPVTARFNFDEEELVLDEEFIDANRLQGTRARSQERILSGNRRVHGPIKMQPTAEELTLLLPWILGGTPSGTTYPLADAIPSRYVTIDRGSKVFTYNGCVVNRASFHAARGEPLTLDLDVIGVDETLGNSGTFPALSLDITKQPFTLINLTLSVNSVTVQTPAFQLIIDNDVDPDRFFNSATVTALFPRDRHVTISHPLPFGDAATSYGLGVAGVAVTATFNNGVSNLVFTMANVKYPRHSPRVAGRPEVMFPMEGTAYKTGASTLELVTTLTP